MEKTELRRNILRLLGENGRLTAEEIAERIDAAAAEVEKEIRILEQENVIIGYQAIFNEAELPENAVKAIIEVKVKPEREGGFDKIARRLSRFPQVSSLYLMSGSYDLQLEIKGRHDPCIVPRAVPVIEAAAAIAIYDLILGNTQTNRRK